MPRTPCQRLTPTEIRIAKCLVRSGSVGGVAEALDRNIATVRVHTRRLHQKTGCNTSAGVVVWALDHWQCCLKRSA